MRGFLARIVAAFRRRQRPMPPQRHVIRDETGAVLAWWRDLSEAEIAEHRAARDHERDRRPRWLDRRERARW